MPAAEIDPRHSADHAPLGAAQGHRGQASPTPGVGNCTPCIGCRLFDAFSRTKKGDMGPSIAQRNMPDDED